MLFSTFKKQSAFALVLFLSMFVFPQFANAHEYWIEPQAFEIKTGDKIKADLRNGQHFKGNALYYLSGRFTKFDVQNGNLAVAVKGKEGDQPALKHQTNSDGLHILSYQSVFDRITFFKFEKFESYLINQGLSEIVARHKKRGLPDSYFTEQYARAVKALVRVGDGKGTDRKTGLIYEFVAEANPYEIEINDDAFLPVRLYWDGKPMPNHQVLSFQQNTELVENKLMSDATGLVKVPLKGGGKFMLSAVHMYDGDNDPETDLSEWVSYWANLVFAVPGADELLKQQ